MAFQLTSPAFDDDATIPRRHTCTGEDLSPPLAWNEPSPGTRSFALLCHDPDASGGSFHHWAVFDIPPDWRRLPEGLPPVAMLPEGLRQAVNDFRRIGYAGPCPPRGHGIHHYHFQLIALDMERLPLDRNPSCRAVDEAGRSHVLGATELVGVFQR